jgi:N-carbamoyl-L-amino-acid hydrolase
MQHRLEDIEYAEYLFDEFYSIGSTGDGGVTRLGYSPVEDEMHAMFRSATATSMILRYVMKMMNIH